ALHGLGYTAALAESGSNLNLDLGYRIDQIKGNGNDFGKGQASLKPERLDGQAVNELSQLYNQLLRDIGQGDAAGAALTDERRDTLLRLGRELLAGNPSMRLDPISWQTAKGESRVTLAIDLAKPAALDTAPPAAQDLQALVQEAIKGIDVKVTLS